MGRPIKKKWFTGREGTNVPGNLTVTTTNGAEVIIKQVGTGVYEVASGRVKLIDGAPAVAPAPGIIGDAQLQADGLNVSKVTQYRMYFFDGGSVSWRDKEDPIAVTVTLTPPLTTEGVNPPVQATATAIVDESTAANDPGVITGFTITEGGAGYTSAPTVTISGDGTGATATAVLTGDAVTSITVDTGGTGYSAGGTTVTIAAP